MRRVSLFIINVIVERFTAKFGSCKHVIATLLKVYDDQIHNKLVIHSSADEEEGTN